MSYVIISFAQSLDGRIATITGDSRWISGPESLTLSHQLRRDCDAILVGAGTIRRDDPQLSCRHPQGCPSQPWRIILDSQLRLPLSAQVLQNQANQPSLIVYADSADPALQSRRAALEQTGVRTAACPGDANGQPAIAEVIAVCQRRGLQRVYVEGGSQVITSFIRARLFNELWLVCAPMIIGRGLSAIDDVSVRVIADALRLEPFELSQLGQDLVWKLRLTV